MEEESMETQMLRLEALATSVINVSKKEERIENIFGFTCMRILKMYYDTDRDKYDTVVKIIQERKKNDRRNRKQSASRRNNK